jgi:hypothetical protein
MSFFAGDLPSFMWGLAIGACGAFCTSFVKKMGEDGWAALKSRFFFRRPEPLQVAAGFEASRYEAGGCLWVPEGDLSAREVHGFTYYPHPERCAKCYRVTQSRGRTVTEFLMVRPGARIIDGNSRG